MNCGHKIIPRDILTRNDSVSLIRQCGYVYHELPEEHKDIRMYMMALKKHYIVDSRYTLVSKTIKDTNEIYKMVLTYNSFLTVLNNKLLFDKHVALCLYNKFPHQLIHFQDVIDREIIWHLIRFSNQSYPILSFCSDEVMDKYLIMTCIRNNYQNIKYVPTTNDEDINELIRELTTETHLLNIYTSSDDDIFYSDDDISDTDESLFV